MALEIYQGGGAFRRLMDEGYCNQIWASQPFDYETTTIPNTCASGDI